MMNIGRETTEEADDAAPVEMLAQLFEAHGWPCEFVNDDEICGEIQGSWATYQVRGIWRSEDNVLQLLCLPEIRVPDAKRKAAYELSRWSTSSSGSATSTSGRTGGCCFTGTA